MTTQYDISTKFKILYQFEMGYNNDRSVFHRKHQQFSILQDV